MRCPSVCRAAGVAGPLLARLCCGTGGAAAGAGGAGLAVGAGPPVAGAAAGAADCSACNLAMRAAISSTVCGKVTVFWLAFGVAA